MRPTTNPIVMAGVLFQPIRGVILALAFYPLREPLFGKKNGRLVLWWVLIALGILSTFAPSPASIEGMIYTKLPFPKFTGYIEIMAQAFLYSWILFYWVSHPQKKSLNWILGIILAVILLLTTLGLLASHFSAR